MKPELQIILNRVNSLSTYSNTNFNEYLSQVKRATDVLGAMEAEDKSPMLEAWISMGLEEIRKELNNKLSDNFSNLSDERKITEFMYSRSTVSMALTNIIMNM